MTTAKAGSQRSERGQPEKPFAFDSSSTLGERRVARRPHRMDAGHDCRSPSTSSSRPASRTGSKWAESSLRRALVVCEAHSIRHAARVPRPGKCRHVCGPRIAIGIAAGHDEVQNACRSRAPRPRADGLTIEARPPGAFAVSAVVSRCRKCPELRARPCCRPVVDQTSPTSWLDEQDTACRAGCGCARLQDAALPERLWNDAEHRASASSPGRPLDRVHGPGAEGRVFRQSG